MNPEAIRRILPGVRMALGTAMLAIGGVIVVRMAATGAPPLTGTPFLDGAFAIFFILRGIMYFRQLSRSRAQAQHTAEGKR